MTVDNERSLDGVTTVLQQLTLEEKALLCMGSDLWHTGAVPRVGIPAVMLTDGPHGLRKQETDPDHVDLSTSVPATCFPTASALSSSWDPQLVRQIGEAIGAEARAENVAVVLGPGLNIKRSPLCGRNFEYFSEDPLVSGVLAAALVEGIQSQGVGACLKHFAANNQETDRLRVSADVDERTLREIYLPGFEHAVKHARPWTVMCAYNRLNGVYASQHRWLLTEVLRNEWGFDGLVMSDWGAVEDRVAGLEAGLDLEMPPRPGVSEVEIVAAIRSGRLEESALDRTVARLLTLLDRSLPSVQSEDSCDRDAHHALARAAAHDSAVLLRNDGGVLPLRPVSGSTIAVIGEFARTPRFQGAGSSKVKPTRVDVPLDELRRLVPDGVEVAFAAGFSVDADDDDNALRAEAVALAERADHVVLFLGLPPSFESEGFDRDHIDLPSNQVAVLSAVAEVADQIIVVLANGSAVAVAEWEHHAAALLECWLSGQAAGGAVADLLLGRAAPSGKLAETLPRRLEDNSASLNFPGEAGHVRYGEGIFVGYRGYDASRREVSYPFGHGLTYTSFRYDDLDVSVRGSEATGDLAVTVSATITNTGSHPGKEVVQVYVRDVEASVARPVQELKAFTKVALEPGEATRVRLVLDRRAFAFWSVRVHDWVVEPGSFEIVVSASSRDPRLRTTVDIAAPPVRVPLDGSATLEEWLADPEGAQMLFEAFGTDEDGKPRGVLGNPELRTVIGNFPLKRLVAFPERGLDPARLQALIEEIEAGVTTWADAQT